MRSERQLKIGEELRHALAACLMRGDFHWPEGVKPPAVLSVTEVRVSPDLRNATVFIMPLGGENIKPIVRALNDGVGYFRHVIAKEVQLRNVPRLRFAQDESFDYAHKIENLLHEPDVQKSMNLQHSAQAEPEADEE